MFGNIALGLRQRLQKAGFHVIAQHFLRQLDRAAGILDYLHGLKTGELIEEPSATGVHEHQVALQFHELQGGHALGIAEFASGVARQEIRLAFRAAIEHHADIVVARRPRVFQILAGLLFESGRQGIAQPIQGAAQRAAPSLVPSGVPGIATAIGTPALNAVHATP